MLEFKINQDIKVYRIFIKMLCTSSLQVGSFVQETSAIEKFFKLDIITYIKLKLFFRIKIRIQNIFHYKVELPRP